MCLFYSLHFFLKKSVIKLWFFICFTKFSMQELIIFLIKLYVLNADSLLFFIIISCVLKFSIRFAIYSILSFLSYVNSVHFWIISLFAGHLKTWSCVLHYFLHAGHVKGNDSFFFFDIILGLSFHPHRYFRIFQSFVDGLRKNWSLGSSMGELYYQFIDFLKNMLNSSLLSIVCFCSIYIYYSIS